MESFRNEKIGNRFVDALREFEIPAAVCQWDPLDEAGNPDFTDHSRFRRVRSNLRARANRNRGYAVTTGSKLSHLHMTGAKRSSVTLRAGAARPRGNNRSFFEYRVTRL